LKTLHIEAGRHLYGGPRQVLLLLDGLKKRGIEATLACPTESAIAEAATAAGHRVITHPIGGDLDVSAVSFPPPTVRNPASRYPLRPPRFALQTSPVAKTTPSSR